MKACPACGTALDDAAAECTACGVILARYKPRPERPHHAAAPVRPATQRPGPQRPAAPRSAPARPAASALAGGSQLRRLAVLLLVGLLGGGGVAGGYWWFELRPRFERIEDPESEWRPGVSKVVQAKVETGAPFDRHLQLPGGPIGLASGPAELVAANRDDPWGFLRLRRGAENEFEITKQPVIERTYNQRVGLSAVTWNGSRYVGYTQAAWFQKGDGYVFTIHQPDDLQIERVVDAPLGIGAIAWDGSGYWVAARKNTADADEPVFLDRLDRNFERIERFEPPGVGCQGLVWDGKHLWFADVFSDRVYVLDVSGAEPRVVHSQESGFGYLSGVAALDGEIWIAEYGDDRLHRLNPRFQAAWTGAPPPRPDLPLEQAEPGSTPAPLAAADLARLERELRSEDRLTHESARQELRRAGAPVRYARYHNSFAKADPPPDSVQIESFEVAVEGSAIYGTWRILFGEGVFGDRRAATIAETPLGPLTLPILAKYTVRIEGGSLNERVEREFDARSGYNLERHRLLIDGLDPGEYEVDIFVHVQFVDENGTGRVLNESTQTIEVNF